MVPDEALVTEANSLARQLADGPTLAYAAARRLMHQGWTQPLGEQLDLETQAIARLVPRPMARRACTRSSRSGGNQGARFLPLGRESSQLPDLAQPSRKRLSSRQGPGDASQHVLGIPQRVEARLGGSMRREKNVRE